MIPTLTLFFFNDTATTEIYTLSLHDALPILGRRDDRPQRHGAHPHRGGEEHRPTSERATPASRRRLFEGVVGGADLSGHGRLLDRKSTRLNSSHANISYAVFCLKKKKQHKSM